MEKLPVYRALVRLRDFLKSRGARVRVVYLPGKPDGSKVGMDDWFVAGPSRTFDDLAALSQAEMKSPPGAPLEAATVAEALEDAPAARGLTIPLGYEVGPGGIVKVDMDPYAETGKETQTQITRAPVIIGGSLEDIHDGSEAMVLQYLRHKTWREADDLQSRRDERPRARTPRGTGSARDERPGRGASRVPGRLRGRQPQPDPAGPGQPASRLAGTAVRARLPLRPHLHSQWRRGPQ